RRHSLSRASRSCSLRKTAMRNNKSAATVVVRTTVATVTSVAIAVNAASVRPEIIAIIARIVTTAKRAKRTAVIVVRSSSRTPRRVKPAPRSLKKPLKSRNPVTISRNLRAANAIAVVLKRNVRRSRKSAR
ncbi:hypothetical protein, partial [Cronobacter sakazakii]|uniref:hypothetical protein n=1 Tax=Cronobacter sakazakii TaxID=28141 RepID=UPI003F8856BC